MPRMLFALLLLSAAVVSPAQPAAPVDQPQILVFAAASLTDALQDIASEYQKTAHTGVKLSFAASSSLARQIEAGAHADLFLSADTDWMDYLEKRNLIRAATRRNLLGNTLVLIAPAHSAIKLKIAPHFPLAAALGDGHLATGDPDSVPVGRYARSALKALDVWDQVAPRIARAENVRVALAYVTHGEAPLGIVYGSDALVEHGVRVVDTFPADTHEPIVYPIALTRSAQASASGFMAYLEGPAAGQVFVRYGFTVLGH